jgi:hypothetical protein
MTTKKTRIDLAKQFQLKPQQLDSLLDELKIPNRQAYEGTELERIEAKITSTNQNPKTDKQPQSNPKSPFDQVMGEMNQQQAPGNPSDTASALKQGAQSTAAQIATMGNLMTAHYLQTGQFDDPRLMEQVNESKALLNQTIAGTTGDCSLGKLFAAVNILRFNQLPAVAAEHRSTKLLESGQP